LRASIHYRSWGQKDPLVEYKQDAYSMFVDLMHDLANTFTERFLKAQLVFEQAPAQSFQPPPPEPRSFESAPHPTRRFNAMGILEDVPSDGPVEVAEAEPDQADAPPAAASRAVAVGTPSVVGAGSIRSLAPGGGALPPGWENTPRNNACPCGSGKKFKKCHGANL
jgi:preprotein translocase subunit SecA